MNINVHFWDLGSIEFLVFRKLLFHNSV